MKKQNKDSESPPAKMRPARDPEMREQQMIAYAIDLAEKQLREGTASSQVITHYLKLGTSRANLEREIMEKQRDLYAAKAEALKSAKRTEEMFEEAMRAMRSYQGQTEEDEDAGDY